METLVDTASATIDKNLRVEKAIQQNRVLVVEDSKSLLVLLCAYVHNYEDLEALPASSMSEAKDQIEKYSDQIYCAISDLNLPDSPNGEIVDLIQQYDIPVIVLTGSMDATLRDSMLEKSVLDYVVKSQASELEYVASLVNRLYKNKSTKVLVVDDSPSYRAYLKALLDRYCYETLTAENGRKGLQVLAENPDISLIISDLNMPEMDGSQMIVAIRQDYQREDLSIIGLSDTSKKGISAMLLKAGANDFVAKGFEIEEFYCRVMQNIDMIRYVRQIRDTATRDFLTKIHNRNYLFDVGAALYENARRGNIKIAAALIDADHFKNINDTHGHHVGDEALKAIASCLVETLRTSDVVARFGGEEFVCMVIVDQESDAREVFERVRQAIELIELKVDNQIVPLRVSIGVSLQLGDSLDLMLQQADEAVYKAKEAGRNCVVCL